MRILVNDHVGHPHQAQLSRALARRDHDVLHTYTTRLQTPRGGLSWRNDDPPNFAIIGINLSMPFDRYGLIKRFAQEKELGRALAFQAQKFQPDVVISANTPLEAQESLLSAARKVEAKFVFWLQDLLGIGIKNNLKKKIPLIGDAIGNYFIHLERSIMADSDAIVTITEDFIPILVRGGIPSAKIHVINNWAPLEEMPCHEKSNSWSRRHGLDKSFCFLYSGTLGLKHNPALLVELSQTFKKREHIKIVVISEGLGAEYIRDKKIALRLDNLILLPFQPFEELPLVLASADILIAILERDAGVFSVPSKVMTYLCTQRPLLLSIPAENLAARIVNNSRAGIVVPPADISGFMQASEMLAGDAELRNTLAENGYRHALSEFSIQKITDRFEEIIGNLKSPVGHHRVIQNISPL